jgi:hypothetical protein
MAVMSMCEYTRILRREMRQLLFGAPTDLTPNFPSSTALVMNTHSSASFPQIVVSLRLRRVRSSAEIPRAGALDTPVTERLLLSGRRMLEQVGAAVTLWARIWEVLGSNLRRDTGYPERRFSMVFLSPPPREPLG